ncbi:MAG: outer membrane beta-barrel protein, partial [Bacteroidota bacterium]
GAQVYVAPVEGWDAYLNVVTGGESGTEIDLTTTFQVSESFMLGLNAASYSDGADDPGSFLGAAIYGNLAVSDDAALGLRYEYFEANAASGILADVTTSVSAFTLSGNIGGGDLTFIPEVRYDVASNPIFLDSDGNTATSAAQFLLAAVFAF